MAHEASSIATKTETPARPWHDAFPAPAAVARAVTRQEVLQWLGDGRVDFVLVDVRRTDCEVGFIVSLFCLSVCLLARLFLENQARILYIFLEVSTIIQVHACGDGTAEKNLAQGRHDTRLYQSACAVTISYNPCALWPLFCGEEDEDHMVLR